MRSITTWLVVTVGIALLGQSVASSQQDQPPGRFISLAGRNVHLFCDGAGTPTVVIEVGSSTPASAWRGVQDKIAAFSRVCAYDRAGYGWSDPEPRPRSMVDRAKELHTVLSVAGENGPYVLVGHSYGGFLVRLFAKQTAEVVGIVLVDANEEGNFFSEAAIKRWDQLGRILEAAREKEIREGDQKAANFYRSIEDELASNDLVPPAMRRPGGFGTLGELPLVVIARALNKPFTGIDAALEPTWREGQERLAKLSSRGRLVIAERSDHNIQNSEPDLIVAAVRDLVALARQR